MKKLFFACAALLALTACNTAPKAETGLPLFAAADFDTIINDKAVSLYTLRNAGGMTAQITNYGAIITDLWVPAADGAFTNVVLGYPSIASYFEPQNSFAAAVIGPYANRIAKGTFTIDGKTYTLPINNGENTLHGGPANFAKKVWDARPFTTAAGDEALELTYVMPDGDSGFPGNLTVTVVYTVTADNALKIEYKATTDAPTVINLTNHAYFNLTGEHARSSNSHMLTINADTYTPTDGGLIPTGEILPVEGTALDFRIPTAVGERVMGDFPAFANRNGYDHNYVINRPAPGLAEAAVVYEPSIGIVMTVLTDAPGIQFYSGRSRMEQDTTAPAYRSAIALEAQNYPDAPNHANFPSAVLRPGETYTQTTIYAFSTKQ